MHKKISSALLLLNLLVLVSCGGGGGSSATSDAMQSSGPSTQSNAFSSMDGTYVVACDGRTDGNAVTAPGSADGAITVGSLTGTDRAQVSVHFRDYTDTTCSSSALNNDLMVSGEIRDLGQTKAYVLAGQPVTAKVVEFTYSSVSFARNAYSGTLPTPGMTTKVAFLLVGNQLYLSKGSREADGVGDSLSDNYGVKQ